MKKKKLFFVQFLIVCLAGCNAGGKEAIPQSDSASLVSSTSSKALTSASQSSPPKGQGQKGNVRSSMKQLPGLDELYAQAKERGVTAGLSKIVQVRAKDFPAMGEAERAIEVGIFLASLAISSSDADKDVPLPVLEDAQRAINSLKPPAEADKYMAEMIAEVKSGLKGKDLRVAIDRMMAKGVPSVIEADPAFATKARLVRLGAYMRTLALVSKNLIGTTDTQKLSVLSQRPDHEFHLETVAALSDNMKQEGLVKKVTEALDKTRGSILKPDPNAEDAKLISEAMSPFAN